MIPRSARKRSARWPTRLKPRLEADHEIRSPDAVGRRGEAEPDRLRIHRERIEHLLGYSQLVVSRLHTHYIESAVVERDEGARRPRAPIGEDERDAAHAGIIAQHAALDDACLHDRNVETAKPIGSR